MCDASSLPPWQCNLTSLYSSPRARSLARSKCSRFLPPDHQTDHRPCWLLQSTGKIHLPRDYQNISPLIFLCARRCWTRKSSASMRWPRRTRRGTSWRCRVTFHRRVPWSVAVRSERHSRTPTHRSDHCEYHESERPPVVA